MPLLQVLRYAAAAAAVTAGVTHTTTSDAIKLYSARKAGTHVRAHTHNNTSKCTQFEGRTQNQQRSQAVPQPGWQAAQSSERTLQQAPGCTKHTRHLPIDPLKGRASSRVPPLAQQPRRGVSAHAQQPQPRPHSHAKETRQDCACLHVLEQACHSWRLFAHHQPLSGWVIAVPASTKHATPTCHSGGRFRGAAMRCRRLCKHAS